MTALAFLDSDFVDVVELARITNVERRKLRRMLLSDGVNVRRYGRGRRARWTVHTESLRTQMPDVYAGIVRRLERLGECAGQD